MRKPLSDIGGIHLWLTGGLVLGGVGWLSEGSLSPVALIVLIGYAVWGLVVGLTIAVIISALRALINVFRRLVPASSGGSNGPDEEGGAGVTSPLKPSPPVLSGHEAKSLPKEENGRESV